MTRASVLSSVMRYEDNVTCPGTETREAATAVALGAAGVLAFSFTLPATRLAVEGGLDPWLVAFGRAVVAAVLASVVLGVTRAPLPASGQWRGLAIVAGGVVVGFPLCTSLALETETAAHAIVLIAILPALTAAFAVARAGERPSPRFWLAALLGMAIVLTFAVSRSAGGFSRADGFLLAGTVLCALGYAEGGALARTLGGARTICWALVLALPATAAVSVVALAVQPPAAVGATAWLGFAYVAVISMFLGFFAWYAGLARGGVAKVGQVQLAQPLLGLVWAALVLAEPVGIATALAATGVLASVAATQRAGVSRVGPWGSLAPCPSPPPRSASATPRRSTPSVARR